jgi:hypothetical protein
MPGRLQVAKPRSGKAVEIDASHHGPDSMRRCAPWSPCSAAEPGASLAEFVAAVDAGDPVPHPDLVPLLGKASRIASKIVRAPSPFD